MKTVGFQIGNNVTQDDILHPIGVKFVYQQITIVRE
jgi:hypothetical protein